VSELKPCPCCEHDANIIIHKGIGKTRYYVNCPRCGIHTNEKFSEAEVCGIWNNRCALRDAIAAAPQPPDDELARLEREMGGIINDLLEVAEQAVDTRQCSIGILRAMNGARAYLAKRMEQTS
jgi:hypothetical protein